jgi:CheY-like chemotaxis protein
VPRKPTFAAVTASLNLGDRERIAVTGFDGYIQKPIDHETFVGKIERFLNGSRGGTRRQKRSDFGPRGRRPAR